MAVWSIQNFCTLFPGLDIAAEHYHPDKLKQLDRLNHHDGVVLSSVAKSTRMLLDPSLQKELPVFDLGAATQHFLDSAQAIEQDRISTKKLAKAGDVLVSRLRSYLKQVAVIPDDIQTSSVSTEFIVLRSSSNCDVSFLVPFILSDPVQTILAWSQDGNEHPRFNESILLELKIPSSILMVTDEINRLMNEAQRAAIQARLQLQRAEAELFTALGLDRVDLAPRLFYEDTFAHTDDAARLDAEYFSPRMQNVIETLSSGGKTISDVAPLSKRRFKAVPGKPFDYIEIADIGTVGTAGSNTVPGEDAPSRATWIVKPGDVITTTVRPIRRLSAIILPEQDGFVCSSGFAVLRPRDIEPELLLTYLRLPLVAELLDLHTTASMYPAISTADLLRIPFRLPDAQARAKIVYKVRESFAARTESLRLLDDAKRTVEAAILEGGKS
jgi:hypothetical protein